MDDKVYDLSDIKLLDIYGLEAIELNGNYSAESIIDLIVNEWIPLFECHKCDRSDYCKYAERIGPTTHRMKEINCGVVVSGMTNFINRTYHLLEGMSLDQRQKYFDGAFYLSRFLFKAELAIGSCMSDEYMDYLGDYAPRLFGSMTNLRDHLNSLGSLFQYLPDFYHQRAILFVEGWSEKAFIDRLKESHMLWFLDTIVEVYGGSGNRRLKRIEMLLKKYCELGYKIFIQGDADGNSLDIFRSMAERDLISDDNTFVFTHDFESAVPCDILFKSLQSLGELENVHKDDLSALLLNSEISVNRLILDEFHLDLKPLKIDLASMIADVLNHTYPPWWTHGEFMVTELGQFLDFIRKVR